MPFATVGTRFALPLIYGQGPALPDHNSGSLFPDFVPLNAYSTMWLLKPVGRPIAHIIAVFGSKALEETVVKKPGRCEVAASAADEASGVSAGLKDVCTFHVSTLFPPLLTIRPIPSAPW